MFNGIYFEYPFFSYVILIFIVCAILCKYKKDSIYFVHIDNFFKDAASSSKIILFLKWLSVATMILSIMSPVKDKPYEADPKEGYEIALIVDASESMSTKGFDVNNENLSRFDVVKEIVSSFIKNRQSDNIGFVVFGEFAFIASPLTYDKEMLNSVLSRLHIGIAGRYTALNTSLAQSVNLLKMGKSKNKIAILLTDGYSTKEIDKVPLDVSLEMIKKEGIKVYPIGIGFRGEYNAEVLDRVAKESGGETFEALNATELKEVYARIDELEKSKIKNISFVQKEYFYQFPLFVSFLSLMFYVYLRNKRVAL